MQYIIYVAKEITNQFQINASGNNNRLQEVLDGKATGNSLDDKLKGLIEFLEGQLSIKAPAGNSQQKLNFLTSELKTRETKEQIHILKQVDNQFGSKENSPFAQQVQALKKDVLQNIKEKLQNESTTNKEEKENISSQFIDTQNTTKIIAKKPFEQRVSFQSNLADHNKGFFEDSAFKMSEFALEDPRAKEAYRMCREADKFWTGEKEFLTELKDAGSSTQNQAQLDIAFRDLITLQLQMSSNFDVDFENLEQGKLGQGERDGIAAEIASKKAEIRELHSNLA
jgi:hypothetical protein